MRIVAFTNAKGGVGKTTTTVNVAGCLAEMGYRVLVIDMDRQGNTSNWLEAEPNQGSMVSVMLGGAPLDSMIQETAYEPIHIVPAAPDLGAMDAALAGQPEKLRGLAQATDKLVAGEYDFVLIDTPPAMGMAARAALVAAHGAVIPVDASLMAVQGLVELHATMQELQETFAQRMVVLGILLVSVDKRQILDRDVVEGLEDRWGNLVFESKVRQRVSLKEAVAVKDIIVNYDPKGDAAEDYRAVTREIIERMR